MEIRILNINELNIEEISKKVSDKRIKRAEKFKYEEDKRRSIAVEYLLNTMIEEKYPDISVPVDLEYDEHKKPHLYIGKDEIHFSLSHSGDYVACIIADYPCGIDIEKYSENRDYHLVAKRICTDNEMKLIGDRSDFYMLWTLKESALKAVGLGLALDMKKLEFTHLNESCYVTNIDSVEYKGIVLDAPKGYSLSYVIESN